MRIVDGYDSLQQVDTYQASMPDLFDEAAYLLHYAGKELVNPTTNTRVRSFVERTKSTFKATLDDFYADKMDADPAAVIALTEYRVNKPKITYLHVAVGKARFDRLTYAQRAPNGDILRGDGLYMYEDRSQPYVTTSSFVQANSLDVNRRQIKIPLVPRLYDADLLQRVYDRLGEAYDDLQMARSPSPLQPPEDTGTTRARLQLIKSVPEDQGQ